MMVIVVLTEPSRLGLVLSELAETSSLSEAGAVDLYATMLRDVCITVERSGGNPLINYRAKDGLSDEFAGDHDPEAEIWSVVADAPGGTDNAWSEPQAGSVFFAHAGNTISHLFNEEEEVHPTVVVRPIAPLPDRAHSDSAVMKLRSTPVILGSPMEDRIYFSGFLDPIDFIDVYTELEVEALARRADDVSHSFDYVLMLPTPKMGANLVAVMPVFRSRVGFERLVLEHTTTFVFEEGL